MLDKNLLESPKHSYYLQNNELTKIQGGTNYEEFHDFIVSCSERKYLLNFDTPLMNIEKTPKLTKKYIKENALMERTYLDKWIDTVPFSQTYSSKFERCDVRKRKSINVF